MEEVKKERQSWISLLKVIAISFVVLLHTMNKGVGEQNFNKGLLIYYLGTLAIPLFFTINGYLLLNKKRDYKYAFKKILKIISIIAFFNLVYFLIRDRDSLPEYFKYVYLSFIQKDIFKHYWFMGSLIIIYLALPLLCKLFDTDKYKYLTYSLIIFSIIIDIINIIIYHKYGTCIRKIVIQTFRIWTWFCYFVLGGYINKTSFLEKINKRTHFLILLFCMIIFWLYEILFSYRLYGNLYAENFYDSWICIITLVLFFTFIKKIDLKVPFINELNELTMGIYIIHPWVIKEMKNLISFNSNYKRLLLFVIVLLLSTLISFIISKIPLLKKTIKL